MPLTQRNINTKTSRPDAVRVKQNITDFAVLTEHTLPITEYTILPPSSPSSGKIL